MASRQLPADRKRRRWTFQSDPFSPRSRIASGVLNSDILHSDKSTYELRSLLLEEGEGEDEDTEMDMDRVVEGMH